MVDQRVTVTGVLQDRISKPLGSIRRGFGGLGSTLTSLNSQAARVATSLGGIAGSAAGLQALREGVRLAERQFQAEQRVLGALRGRRDELERIKTLASDIQSVSRVGDEELLELAANLLNAGVAASDLDRNLKAIVDTAAATGQSIELVSRGVQQFQGNASGFLGRFIPELRELQAENRLAADGVDFLLSRFSGTEATLALNSFGQANQISNTLGDTLERIGLVVVDLFNDFRRGLNPAVERVANFLESDGFTSILPVVRTVTAQVGRIAPLIAGIATALGTIAVASFVAPVIAVSAKVALIASAVTGIALFLDDIFGISDRLQPIVDRIRRAVVRVLGDLKSGQISVEDIFDTLRTEGENFARLFDAFFLNPLKNFVGAALDVVGEVGELFLNGFTFVGLSLASLLRAPLVRFFNFATEQIDEITGSLADALELIGADNLASRVRTNFSEFQLDPALIERSARISKLVFEKTVEDFDPFGSILERGLDIVNTVEEALDASDARGAALAERIADRRGRRNAQSAQEAAEERRQAILEREAINEEVLNLESRLQDAIANQNASFRARRNQQELADLEDSLRRQLISFDDYIEQRSILEIGPLQERADAESVIVQQIRDRIDAIREESGANADVRLELAELIAAREREQTAIADVVDQQRELNRLVEGNRLSQGELLVTAAEDARAVLEDTIATLNNNVADGTQTQVQAAAQADSAFNQYRTTLASVRQELQNLIDENPELIQLLGEQVAAVDSLDNGLSNLKVTVDAPAQSAGGEGGFFGGLKSSLTSFSDQFSDATALGENFGGALVSSFNQAAAAFLRGESSFSSFAVSFLQNIAVMLLQLATFRALSAALGLGAAPAVVAGLNGGGPVVPLERNSGGAVPGGMGGPNVDTVPALLTTGEHVIQRPAVAHYGRGIMDMINNRLLPKELFAGISRPSRIATKGGYNTGGGVGGAGGGVSVGNGITRAIVVSDEQSFDRQLNGGQNALDRVVGRRYGIQPS